jgi:hypothetical protein
VDRETLDEQEILRVTALPRVSAMENEKLPVAIADSKIVEPSS